MPATYAIGVGVLFLALAVFQPTSWEIILPVIGAIVLVVELGFYY